MTDKTNGTSRKKKLKLYKTIFSIIIPIELTQKSLKNRPLPTPFDMVYLVNAVEVFYADLISELSMPHYV